MTRQQIIWAKGAPQKWPFWKRKTETSEQKLKFNWTYYPATANRNILQELYLSFVPNKGNKKVFLDVTVVRFCNGSSIKDYLVRVVLPKTIEVGRYEPCGQKTCFVCNSISDTVTSTVEVCKVTFKIQCSSFNTAAQKKSCTFWNKWLWWGSICWNSQT